MKITILNTSILTAYGSFTYTACSLKQAKKLIKKGFGFTSAVGHESTAAVISTLLGVEVKMNRIQYQQQPGDIALVFKLKGRAPEGKILTVEEIEEIGYEWGTLERTDGQSRGADVIHWFSKKIWRAADKVIIPVVCMLMSIIIVFSTCKFIVDVYNYLEVFFTR